MKIYLLLLLSVVSFSCGKRNQDLKAKNKTIDSLKAELQDCKSQAQIMADVMENERILMEKKKATE